MDTQFGLSPIGQIPIRVEDQQRAVTFYRNTLGSLFKVPGLTFFDCAGLRLLVDTLLGEKQDKQSSIILTLMSEVPHA
jgi:hypothetical protein